MKIQFSRASEKIWSHFFSRFFEIETLVNDCHLCIITYWHLHNTKMKISDQVSQVATLTDQRHICAIMAAVSDKVNKLQELNLSGNDLSKVACKHLMQAVQVLSRWLPTTWQELSDI